MLHDHVVLPQAESDVVRAFRWYLRRSPHVAGRFLSDLDATVRRIVSMPLANSPFDARHRVTKLKRFRYLVLYRFDGKTVWVVAVGHAHRSSRYWNRRAK
jgi:plasmid stabilization system protein ParE